MSAGGIIHPLGPPLCIIFIEPLGLGEGFPGLRYIKNIPLWIHVSITEKMVKKRVLSCLAWCLIADSTVGKALMDTQQQH